MPSWRESREGKSQTGYATTYRRDINNQFRVTCYNTSSVFWALTHKGTSRLISGRQQQRQQRAQKQEILSPVLVLVKTWKKNSLSLDSTIKIT